MALGLKSIAGGRVEWTPVERLANEVSNVAKGPLVVDALVVLLSELVQAGPNGMKLGTARGHRGCAFALLDAAGAVEVAPAGPEPSAPRLRLSTAALSRLRVGYAPRPVGN